ncbi:MAG: PGF-pre-PGF domain-containing protein [ANME-2 cluster archaeon]|nr:PGF-pre-PGF domain-containing protein [ANME-2 cluster archaeon]
MIHLHTTNRMHYTLLILFSLLLFSVNLAGPASATAMFSISPSTQHVEEGQSFTLSVYVEPDVPISGAQFNLGFDSALVQVISVTEGGLLNKNGATTIFSNGTIDNSLGTITNVYGVILGKSNVTAPGIFANISLVALNTSGTCAFQMSNVVISNSTGYSLPVIVKNGDATIGDIKITSSNGGTGGGGGGGDPPDETFENIICTETDREYVNKGSAISYQFDLECNLVEYINFNALSSSGEIAAKVEILENTSSLVDKAPPGIVFKNLNIWVGNYGWATEKNIRDTLIGFKVDRSWVSQNNINESSITMYRFHESQWVPLNTTKLREDADNLFLEAKTPGFSPYAITGSSYSQASTDDEVTDKDGQNSALDGTTGSAKSNTLISGILLALFAVLYGVILFLSQKIRTMVLFCRDDLKDPETVDDMNALIRGSNLYDGPFREIPLTKEANILLERKPEGDDCIRFNRLLLETAYPQEIVRKLHGRFGPLHWVMLLVIVIPLVGLIDMVGSPLNWVIGILLECVIVMYLVLKVKTYSSTSRVS